jgi:hypothetical protein
VECQHYEIKVQILEDGTRVLNDRRDELIEEKQRSEKLNEDLRQQSKAQTEIAQKQLQNKMNRDRSEIIRDLMA